MAKMSKKPANRAGNQPRKKYSLKRPRNWEKLDLNSFDIPTSNKFSALSEDDNNITDLTPKQVKLAPIVVTNKETNIQTLLTKLKITCDIKIVSIGKIFFVNSPEDKIAIINELKTNKIDHYSHPDVTNKIFKVILSGLPEVETKEIEEELSRTHNFTPIKITMFKTNSQNKLYLCEFNKGEVNMKKINTVKTVYHHIIKWQKFKPKRAGPTQCMRCLMFGHGISSCSRFLACARCGQNHLTRDCTVITSETKNPAYRCFNCASADLPFRHQATDPVCPFRAKYMASVESARSKNKNQTQRKHNIKSTVCAGANSNTSHRIFRSDDEKSKQQNKHTCIKQFQCKCQYQFKHTIE